MSLKEIMGSTPHIVKKTTIKEQRQLNVLIPTELHRDCKIKAINQGRDLTSVVNELLQNWIKLSS